MSDAVLYVCVALLIALFTPTHRAPDGSTRNMASAIVERIGR